jgi:hypothetical protein
MTSSPPLPEIPHPQVLTIPPLIVFIFMIDRLAAYLGDLGRDQHPSLAHYWAVPPQSGGPYETGPMWFVAALLVFSLAYALLRRVHPLPVVRRWSGAQVMVAAALLIAVTVAMRPRGSLASPAYCDRQRAVAVA